MGRVAGGLSGSGPQGLLIHISERDQPDQASRSAEPVSRAGQNRNPIPKEVEAAFRKHRP